MPVGRHVRRGDVHRHEARRVLYVPEQVLAGEAAFPGPLHLRGVDAYVHLSVPQDEAELCVLLPEAEEPPVGACHGEGEAGVADDAGPFEVVVPGFEADRRGRDHAAPAAARVPRLVLYVPPAVRVLPLDVGGRGVPPADIDYLIDGVPFVVDAQKVLDYRAPGEEVGVVVVYRQAVEQAQVLGAAKREVVVGFLKDRLGHAFEVHYAPLAARYVPAALAVLVHCVAPAVYDHPLHGGEVLPGRHLRVGIGHDCQRVGARVD